MGDTPGYRLRDTAVSPAIPTGGSAVAGEPGKYGCLNNGYNDDSQSGRSPVWGYATVFAECRAYPGSRDGNSVRDPQTQEAWRNFLALFRRDKLQAGDHRVAEMTPGSIRNLSSWLNQDFHLLPLSDLDVEEPHILDAFHSFCIFARCHFGRGLLASVIAVADGKRVIPVIRGVRPMAIDVRAVVGGGRAPAQALGLFPPEAGRPRRGGDLGRPGRGTGPDTRRLLSGRRQ
jgi:hypothetical protein